MNLLLLEPNEVRPDDTASLDGRRAEHVRQVLRAAVGDQLRAGVVGGRLGTATVTALSSDPPGPVELALALSEPPSPPPTIDLVLALPRPKVARRVLQTIATMGVHRVDLINAWRVDKSYLRSPAYGAAEIRRQLILGCEQGRTTWLPQVTVHERFVLFFERRNFGDSVTLAVAHPGASTTLQDLRLPMAAPLSATEKSGRLVLAIGPEGGWIEREVTTFVDRGFTPVCLSQRILRVETAVTAALAQFELLSNSPAASDPAADGPP